MKSCKITAFPACSYALQEGFNTLSTNLTFSGQDMKKILITSSTDGEGKSLIAMNLLRTLAELGHKVVLVDMDLRRSQIRSRYRIAFDDEQPQGVAHYLAGMCGINDILYVTDIPGACLVPCGRTVKNSLQLITAAQTRSFLDELSKHFDYVLVDTPPVGIIIDAAQIAASCDGALLVVAYNYISQKELREVSEQITGCGIPILGTVINKVDVTSISGKHYYSKGYYSRYDAETGSTRSGKKKRRRR